MRKCENVQMSKCANEQMSKCADVQMGKWANCFLPFVIQEEPIWQEALQATIRDTWLPVCPTDQGTLFVGFACKL
jgi:hypothetical protein